MAKPPGPGIGDPPGYTDDYYISIGKNTTCNASITLDTSITGATVILEIDNGAGWTVLGTTTTNFVASTAKTLEGIFGSYIIWVAAAPIGVRYFRVRISGGTPAMTEVEFQIPFEVTALPVISAPLLDDTTITDLQNLTATATVSNTPTEAMIIFYSPGTSNVVYQTEMAIAGSALSVTIPYGSIPIGTYLSSNTDIKIVASNAYGLDTDETLSLTVSASSNVEPVLHIYNLLYDNWNAGNVTKPQMMKGGDVGGDKYLADGDVIKIYRSPSTTTRKSRGLGMTHEDTDDYVLIDINTITSRAQLRLLEIEATRVFTSFRKDPGGGYSWLWSDKLDTRAEYADHFRQVYEVHLKRIGKAVST